MLNPLASPWEDKEGEDGTSMPTLFLLSPLSNGAIMALEGGGAYWHQGPPGIGSQQLIALKDGFVGALNAPLEDGVVDPDQFVPADAVLPYLNQGTRDRMVKEIFSRSYLDAETTEGLRCCVRTARLKADAEKPDAWSCSTCMNTPLQAERRCPFLFTEEEAKNLGVVSEMNRDLVDLAELQELSKGKLPAHITYGGHQHTRCPVGSVTPSAASLYKWVVCTDQGSVDPLKWLEVPGIYSQAANEVALERHRLEKVKKEGVKVEPQGEDPLKGKKNRRWRKPKTKADIGGTDT